MKILRILLVASFAMSHSVTSEACSIFTVVRDGQVLMGNNEDYILPGVVWFVPATEGILGRVNVGFDTDFAQGSMNEKGLSFDGAALQPIAWEPDPDKETPPNLIEKIMNECATVAEAIEYFQKYNCPFMKNSQLMFADATGDSAVISWLPEKGLSVVRIDGDHQVVTNNRLEASGYRCQRFVKAEQTLAERKDASLETMTAVMESVHNRGPAAFTSYSTVYDLKNKKMFIYNLANFEEVVELDVLAELAKGSKKYPMRKLFDNSPKLKDIKKGAQRSKWETRITLDSTTLDRYVGSYAPDEAPDIRLRVERENNELRVINPGQPAAHLFPETETQFRVKPDRGQVSFHLDADGTVTGFTLHKQNDQHAKRVNE
jgi:hypothetical protein